jgi:hypothetical protein
MRRYLKVCFLITFTSTTFLACTEDSTKKTFVNDQNCHNEIVLLKDSLQNMRKMNDSLQVVLFFSQKRPED